MPPPGMSPARDGYYVGPDASMILLELKQSENKFHARLKSGRSYAI